MTQMPTMMNRWLMSRMRREEEGDEDEEGEEEGEDLENEKNKEDAEDTDEDEIDDKDDRSSNNIRSTYSNDTSVSTSLNTSDQGFYSRQEYPPYQPPVETGTGQ
ncbi:hypothetical protein MMC31_000070 [Peltigera leucophlebia]|nr:hypothetical protein [Peltigera leucophlebia]